MPATISESYLSRPFSLSRTPGRELVYEIHDTDDETEVQTLLAATAPATYLGLERESLDAEPLGGGHWRGTARYTRLDDSEYTFDTGGGVQHITQSLSTINSYAPPGSTAPNFQGAIGVTEDRVEGVDIPAPNYQFTETHYLADATVLAGYNLVLFNLTGKVNDATFKGFASGECLFLGASGSKRGDERWAITYRFACQPNVSGLTVGDITGIDKLGWDYLWLRYATYEDSGANSLVQRPLAAYVERVFLPGDFSLLAIGT